MMKSFNLLFLLLFLLTIIVDEVNSFTSSTINKPAKSSIVDIQRRRRQHNDEVIRISRRDDNRYIALSMSTIMDDTTNSGNNDLFQVVDLNNDNESLFHNTAGTIAGSSLSNNNMNELINKGILGGVFFAMMYHMIMLDANIWHGWSMKEIIMRIPMNVWEQYTTTLTIHPIMTKACTSATVYTIGDIIAQRSEGVTTIGEIDRARKIRSMMAGLIGHGPLSHCWYNICDNLFENILHCTAWWSVVPKVVIDQTIWGPIWNNMYIVLLGIMKLQSPNSIISDIKRTTIPLILSGLKLWPAAHIITYGFIPIENRLLWVDMVEIIWVTILATQANNNNNNELLTHNRNNNTEEIMKKNDVVVPVTK